MTSYIPGSGLKKSLNMLQSPIYPEIKKAPPEFKWSKKHWEVDVGKTLMDTETNTQIIEDAVLARSYRDNIDRYGQGSHQEKIVVFRPPVQNSYQDHQPLNRYPATATAITARINPSTVTDNGTTAFLVNNTAMPEISRYITDKITTNQWFSTYYSPMELPPEDYIHPDLELNIPSHSSSAGYNIGVTVNGNHEGIQMSNKTMDRLSPSAHSGTVSQYNTPYHEQTSGLDVSLQHNIPLTSAHSGYSTSKIIDGETGFENIVLIDNRPNVSVSSGNTSQYRGEARPDTKNVILSYNKPQTSSHSGMNTSVKISGQTGIENMKLNAAPTVKMSVVNPSSDSGFKTSNATGGGYIRPEDHVKLRENPRVSVTAGNRQLYRNDSNVVTNQPHFKVKMQPIKSYNAGLDQGTILMNNLQPITPTVKIRGQQKHVGPLIPRY